MKKYLAAFTLLFAMTACGGGADKPLEGTTWKLAEMEGIPAEAINAEEDAFTLHFDAQEKMMAGRTNCNRFFGGYTVDGKKLMLNNMGMTRMACPDMQYEDAFVKMLDGVDGFEISGDMLTLLHGKERLASFRAVAGAQPQGEAK